MPYRKSFILCLTAALCCSALAQAESLGLVKDNSSGAFVGQDFRIDGPRLIAHHLSSGPHILVFPAGCSMTIGAHEYSAGSSVVWIDTVRSTLGSDARLEYRAKVYLQSNVSASKAIGAKITDLKETMLDQGNLMVCWFSITGEVLVSAKHKENADPRGLELYAKAFAAFRIAGIEPDAPGAEPLVVTRKVPLTKLPTAARPGDGRPQTPKERSYKYPLNMSPMGAAGVQPESGKASDGTDILTIIGRYYIWQKQNEKGKVLELQADCAVVFLAKDPNEDPNNVDPLQNSGVKGVYLCGDVLMTEGPRTIRADQLYYDFETDRAVLNNAEMKSFDPIDGIPIYVRAEKLRKVAANQFAAENANITTSEFHTHQIDLEVGTAVITDTTPDDMSDGTASEKSYEADMHDVKLKVYDKTLLHLPHMHANSERPDIPIKSVQFGHNSRWGQIIETRWYMDRLLGYEDPEGVDSTWAMDYYSDRGVGGGVEVEYSQADYFGKTLGYIVNDRGEDKLGRDESRDHLEPPRNLRGRYLWQHRQYLPNNWQLSAEFSYVSDENFMEGYYRSEYNVGKRQETLLHMKRTEDNWGFSSLGKVRINDWSNELEELPSLEYHRTGQSFWGDTLTFYSDSQVSRLRQRYGSSTTPGAEDFYSFATTRNEVDMPLAVGRAKVVPFVAGTFAYEDGMGYYTNLDEGMESAEDQAWLGETGVRVSGQPYWRTYPDVKSRMWNLDQLRHVLRPHLTATAYTDSDSPFEQRDTLNVGISQRLQTKRGVGENRRTVDWMRFNTDVTWVSDSGSAPISGPDRFIWNEPFIPVIDTLSRSVPQIDRRSTGLYGPRRNSVAADYLWRVTDTTAVLSDINYDMQSGVVQQFNVGFSRMRWPNLSYYLGSRYLRRIRIGNEKGSNAFIFAISYVLDPRYTLVLSQQYDFDYGATVRNDVTLVRRYHRMFWALTYRADESLDQSGIIFSLWPQGVQDLSVGPRRYMGLGGVAGY